MRTHTEIIMLCCLLILSSATCALATEQPHSNTIIQRDSTVTLQGQDTRYIIFEESFEAPWEPDSEGDLSPPGWENHITDETLFGDPRYSCHWHRISSFFYENEDSAIPPDGNWQAAIFWDPNIDHEQDEWLITPVLDLTNSTDTTISFMFWSQFGSITDHHCICVSPSADYQKHHFTDVLWDSSEQEFGSHHYDEPIVLSLSEYDGSSIRLAIHVYAEGTEALWFPIFIDDLSITSSSGDLRITSFGGLGVSAMVTNTGEQDLTDVVWEITVNRGILLGNQRMGIIPVLNAGRTTIIHGGLLLGIGFSTITIRIGNAEQTRDATFFLFFTILR